MGKGQGSEAAGLPGADGAGSSHRLEARSSLSGLGGFPPSSSKMGPGKGHTEKTHVFI